MLWKADYGYIGLLEFSLNARELIAGALGVDRDQRAPELRGKICGRAKLACVSYRRNNNGVDYWFRIYLERTLSYRWKAKQFCM